jgi:glycerol uptake facilitator-like aquaporin
MGTALLLAAVVGSGIMADRLSGGDAALALLANSLATGAGLFALILSFASISGAHFNPAVTLSEAWRGAIPWRDVTPYLIGQICGAFIGVAMANTMFGETLLKPSSHIRSGTPQLLSEFVAAFGLLLVIRGSSRLGAFGTAAAVAAYITAAYWFTASTSFANPAVTLGRAFTDTFTGIRPADAPGFVAAQLLGAGAATFASRWLDPRVERGGLSRGRYWPGRPG